MVGTQLGADLVLGAHSPSCLVPCGRWKSSSVQRIGKVEDVDSDRGQLGKGTKEFGYLE